MASTASIPSTGGVPPANSLGSAAPQSNGVGRSTMKSASSAKTSDVARKQTASPGDGSQRRPNSQKAWTTGANPITQKSLAPPQQNGNVLQAKQIATVKTPQQKDTATPDRHANDRLVFLLAAAIGTSVTITTKSGDIYEGIFSYSTPDSTETNITLSMTKKIHSAGEAQTNGITDHESVLTGSGPDFAMIFNLRDVADVDIPELSIPTAGKSQNGVPIPKKPGLREQIQSRKRA
jgi:hypothetical protein